jgi:hypothetical protein
MRVFGTDGRIRKMNDKGDWEVEIKELKEKVDEGLVKEGKKSYSWLIPLIAIVVVLYAWLT